MKWIVFVLCVLLLAIWSAGCVGTAAWYYPRVVEGAHQTFEALQALQEDQAVAAVAETADPKNFVRLAVVTWLFISALVWNIIATPLGIIALVVKPR